MKNSQLTTLLSRSALTAEDIHNVSVIFWSLSDERKIHILWNWEIYLDKLAKERQKLNEEYSMSIYASLSQANTLLDEAIARFNKKQKEKSETKRITREELKSAVLYDENQKILEIRNLSWKL